MTKYMVGGTLKTQLIKEELYTFDEKIYSKNFTYYASGDIESLSLNNKLTIHYSPDGSIKKETKDGKIWNGEVMLSYENGNKKSIGNYKDGKEEGLFTTYYENGLPKSEGNYIDGKLGESKVWKYFENDSLKLEGSFYDGKKHGSQKGWYQNGNQKYERNYLGGKEEGLFIEWYSNGKKRSEQKYILGVSSGIKKWTYHENGKVKAEENYLNRKKTSTEGRYAITNYKVTKNFKNYFSEIECKILTGRTHQIRVHMQSINCPLIGDQLYSKNRNISKFFSVKIRSFLKDFRRQALHAQHLSFMHPKSKKIKSFFIEMPNDMINLRNELVAEFNLNC